MEIAVFNIQGKDTGRTISLDENIYSIEPNDHAIYLDVKHFLANQRQGTHKAKEKWEVARTTRKLKKQKGTGGARAGSMKSPLFRGGGRVFGPRPRDYDFKLNKKVKKLARKSALSYKAKDAAIQIVEDFTFEAPKTRQMVDLKNNLSLSDKKLLFVLPAQNKNVYLSARNLPGVSVVTASELNTYTILNAGKIVMCESTVKAIEQMF